MFIGKGRSNQGDLHRGGSILACAWRKWLALGQWDIGKEDYNDRLGRENELFSTTLLATDI